MKYVDLSKNPDHFKSLKFEVDRQLHNGKYHVARNLVKKWHKHELISKGEKETLEQFIDLTEIEKDKGKNPVSVENGVFSWANVNRHMWVLSYNGEMLARLTKNNEHSKSYSVDVSRGGNKTFTARDLHDAKTRAINFAKAEFPGFRSYKQSQPTVAHVNRIMKKSVIEAHGNVVKIEPVAFSTTLYRLTFADGYAAESKIPKTGNPKDTTWVTLAQLNKILSTSAMKKGYKVVKLPGGWYGVQKHGKMVLSSVDNKPQKMAGWGAINYLMFDGALSAIPNYTLDD